MSEGDTPAESPAAKRTMDTRLSGTNEELNGNRPRLSRTPPELAPLPLSPTAMDVAIRYGSDSAFLRQNWPRLVDAVVDLQQTVRAQRVTPWVWPLLCGLFASAAIAAWMPRILAHFGH
jgi:hypothetical protein